ncbi:hypothetical protein [Jiangella anatolica]|uniref:hypothetical protein n=1 Tax=Jiangella anatolica TaxID=2670374 RepID=UPI001313FC4D|nr:hypothetical protein [Jiangella anatolica]
MTSAMVACSVCGRLVEAVKAWFHPGTGDTVCDSCHATAHARHAELTALEGLLR